MAVVSSHYDLLEYMTEWLERVITGRLFPVNDQTSPLLRKECRHCNLNAASNGEITEKVISNTSVQQQWTNLSQDVDDIYVLELLK